jgi:hypothetical protein
MTTTNLHNEQPETGMHGAGVSITGTAWLLGIPEAKLRYLIERQRFPSVRTGRRIVIEPDFIRYELTHNPAYAQRKTQALLALERLERGEIKPPARKSTSSTPPGLEEARIVPPYLRPRPPQASKRG